MDSKFYKYCIVPQCESTTIKTPNKLFIYVPNKEQIRKKWLKLAGRDPQCLSTGSRMYFCEDHFVLPNDMDNYVQYLVMGSVSQVRMKPGCLPTRFECQTDRSNGTSDAIETPYIMKKQRKVVERESKKDLGKKRRVTESLEHGDTSHISSAIGISGKTCKLCLKSPRNKKLGPLSRTTLEKMRFLQINVGGLFEKHDLACRQCKEKIQHAFNFKSRVVDTECSLLSHVPKDKTEKVILRELLGKNSPSTSREKSTKQEVCRLCKEFIDAVAGVSLEKIFKDDLVEDLFAGHIPEIDLELTKNPVVCDTCQKYLISFSTLVTCWSVSRSLTNDNKPAHMKEDTKDGFELMEVKNENLIDFPGSNTSDTDSADENSESEEPVTIKGEISEEERSIGCVRISEIASKQSERTSIKSEPEDITDFSESLILNKSIKTENCNIMNEEYQVKEEEETVDDNEDL